jgi:Acetyltransferase (GNAT) domain
MGKRTEWEFVPALEHFEQMSGDWDALNLARGNHVLLDSKFCGSLIRNFATPDVLLGISKNSQRPGMALVHKRKPGFWEIFTPSQAPLGPVLLANSDAAGEGLRELMNSLPGYPIQLAIRCQDPDYSAWTPADKPSCVEFLEFMQTGRVHLQGTFEAYWQDRGSNLRHNLSRQRRRLKEQGRTLELAVHRTPEAMAGCVRDFGQLESAGWKADLGTAVSENNIQGQFYRDMLERFCATEETVVYQLLIDGKVAASDLCLLRNGMLVVLKTTYDESLPSISAALLMREEIVRHLYSDGACQVVEFYGPVREWHTKWTQDFRPMYHLNCHRNAVVSGIRDLVRSAR